MAKAIIGQPVTFQHLFLDDTGTPISLLNPTIQVYYWDSVGVRQTVLIITVLPPSVPAETGRYAYTLTVPSTLTPDITLYGLLQGEDPTTHDIVSVEQEVSLFNADTETLCPGLTARFVQGG